MRTGLMGIVLAALAGSAQAAVIGGAQLSPSSSLIAANGYPLSALHDGITQAASPNAFPYNGFVSRVSSGTIRFDLVGQHTLDGFVLFNDVNLGAQGVRDFRLTFFDGLGGTLATGPVLTAAVGVAAGQVFNFAAIPSVARVDLQILNVWDGNGIEIRELWFLSEDVVTPVPLPGLAALLLAGVASCRTRRK